MKLYAQHGYAPSNKIQEAINKGFVEGVILSPRYLSFETARSFIRELKEIKSSVDILFDPEYYATRYVGTPNAQLRNLDQWPYFVQKRQNELITNISNVDSVLSTAFQIQNDLGCSAIIAPNVYISGSFDSIEAAIAINFFSQAKLVAQRLGIGIPIYATIAVCKDAIINQSEYINFLNMITAFDNPPDGAYVLIGAGPIDARSSISRSELIIPEVIGGWMLINHTLNLNGFNIINGYSDIITPLLGITQGDAGATGWWSNLQAFSMGRYIKSHGRGQLPLVRYLSKKLINRITINEREAYAEVVPSIMNGLSMDSFYQEREPDRTEEALQSWQALASLNSDMTTGDLSANLIRFEEQIVRAEECYDELYSHGFSERLEANKEYLKALKNSIRIFRELAEI